MRSTTPTPRTLALGLVFLLSGPISVVRAQAPEALERPPAEESAESREVPVVRAVLVRGVGHRDVDSVRVLVDGGGRMAWSAQGDELAFEKADEDGRRQVWLDRFDGAGPTCLTCDIVEFRGFDALDPSWHPSGDYVLLQVRDHRRRNPPSSLELASPHRGLRSELWLVARRGRPAWELTHAREIGGGIVSGRISAEADRLSWAERTASGPEPWGTWTVRSAPFTLNRGQPSIGDPDARDIPSAGYFEVHGYTPDQDRLVVSAWGPDGRAQPWTVPVVGGGEGERLPGFGSEHVGVVAPAPRSDHLALTSDRGLPAQGGVGAADVWIQRSDGGGRERWTFFNDPESDHWIEGGAVVDDLAWHPEGDRLAVHLVHREGEAIWEIRLDPEWSE